MSKKRAQVAEPEVTPRYCGSRLEFLLSLYERKIRCYESY